MGRLIDGEWHDARSDWQIANGRFVRAESKFRNWATVDGSPGPTGEGGFRAARGRYHLYVSRACPWAHRTLIFRSLKGLEDTVGLSVVHWHLGREGWTFEPASGVIADGVNGARLLREIYLKSDPRCTSRVTVPVLWDCERGVIVSNESADIIRMFNSAFDGVGAALGNYYPRELRREIDALNERIYPSLNNGVYRAGFAANQEAYEEAFLQVFETLDWLEARLGAQRYLAGDRVTEADWRLFTTLVRFDAVYYSHFKCNLRRLIDYPNLWSYTRELYQWPGVAATVDLGHIKRHYYGSHEKLNPSGIVPLGPKLDFSAPPLRRA